VAYSKIGASGILFAQLIERMGISADVNAKAVVIPMGLTAERLVSGEAELAVQQISELKQVAGIDVIGPLPLHLQTPAIFAAGVMAAATRATEAERLLRHLASPDVVPALREAGLEPCI
jgi:molybdate transport system substrate-binding protein